MNNEYLKYRKKFMNSIGDENDKR